MNLTFRDNYWDDPELKKQFIQFLIDIHGLDLSLWDSLGFWDWKYQAFSFFEGKSLVSSLCVYSMDMIIRGERRLIAQISSVGTLPEYRRKGLNSELTRRAIKWAGDNHDFFFLFADEEAYPYYKNCGFRLVDEHKVCYPVSGIKTRAGIKKLSVNKKGDLDLVYRCAKEREPVSDILGVYNEKLLMFCCLYFLRENIYYFDKHDILVLYKRKNGLLTIFDIVGKVVPPFSEIYPYLSDNQDETVEFLFMTDKLDLGKYKEFRLEEGSGTHILGEFPLKNSRFIFPYTARA